MRQRVQLSLDFTDEELFRNFIEPYKKCRYLNKIIIKCLSACYYNKEIRLMIEETSIDNIKSEADELRAENQRLKKQLSDMEEQEARYLGNTEDFGLC